MSELQIDGDIIMLDHFPVADIRSGIPPSQRNRLEWMIETGVHDLEPCGVCGAMAIDAPE